MSDLDDASPAAPADDAREDGDALWIERLARTFRPAPGDSPAAVRTALSCRLTPERSMLFAPPEMTSLQPESLRYLHAFAAVQGFELVQERRAESVVPLHLRRDRRDRRPAAAAFGLALLLKQAGLPGSTPMLSTPHRLAADAPLIDLPRLIGMSASAVRRSKRVELLPNRPLAGVLDDVQPISGYACKLDTTPARTILSHFDGPSLRCLGYSTGNQYVMHLCLGGGPLTAPELWSRAATLTRTDLRFRLFRGRCAAEDFGLLYSTFYFDMAARKPTPWWLGWSGATTPPTLRPEAPVELAAVG